MSKCKDCLYFKWCYVPYEVVKMMGGFRGDVELPCKGFKDKSLFVELPCEWGKDVYTVVKGHKKLLKTKLFAIGVTEDGYITYNPTEYPKGVFGINGVILGENTFANEEEAKAKLKEIGK